MSKVIYKIKPINVLRGLESLIDRTIDIISMKNELAWYDPNDPFPVEYGTDEIMMALEFMADEELEKTDNYIAPHGIIMLRAVLEDKGYMVDGGIHRDLLDVIAYQIPPMFSKASGCPHENKYKNQVSRTLSFWYCKDCKQEIK